jgi:hypothetical protein
MVIGCIIGRWRKRDPFPDDPYFTWEIRWIVGMGRVPDGNTYMVAEDIQAIKVSIRPITSSN